MSILEDILEGATKYEPLIKTGVAALSTYASYKDQKKKNELQQQAYDDYMKQVNEAGKEARAAIDINYTPMVVSGVPTTKADVTDFTAVAAKGGLMSIPNRQRKRYARGPDEVDVMEFDEESITPLDLQQETGLDLTGEQVKYNTANPREGAWNVWTSGGIDQEIYEFDFDLFFDSGDWMDYLKGEVPATGNMQMASGPGIGDSRNELAIQLFGKELNLLSEEEMNMLNDEADRLTSKYMATGGIAGLRHGGRPGYAFGPGPVVDQETMAESITLPDGGEEVVTDSMTEIKDQTAGGGDRGWRAQMLAEELAEERYGKEFYDLNHKQQYEIYTIALDMIDSGGNAKGGLPKRVRKAPGGIMNLGGLEKDYRTTGGFVPIGEYEKKDDVPARLSKNEFVMTADAVRAAGGGSINKGAQLMYDTMKHLEARPEAKRMTV
jgi:hypothetical protein